MWITDAPLTQWYHQGEFSRLGACHTVLSKLAIWSPARAVFVAPSPPLFETEVDAPQLSNLGLQAEGFFLARLKLPRESGRFFLAGLELSLESGGFFLTPLELHFESDGFLLAGQQVAERGPPGSGVSAPAALREVGQQAGEGRVRGAVAPEPARRIDLEAPEIAVPFRRLVESGVPRERAVAVVNV